MNPFIHSRETNRHPPMGQPSFGMPSISWAAAPADHQDNQSISGPNGRTIQFQWLVLDQGPIRGSIAGQGSLQKWKAICKLPISF